MKGVPKLKGARGIGSPREGWRVADGDYERTLARLRELIGRGYSLPRAAARLAKPRRTLLDMANRHGLPVRRRNLSAAKDAAIRERLRTEASARAIMRDVGVSFGAVQRRRDLATLERFRKLEGQTVLPTSEWRCPGCGALLKIDRCLVCQTLRPRSRPRGKITRPGYGGK